MPRRKTHEEFVVEMSAVNPGIEILGKYVNSKTRILCKCKTHNIEWEAFSASLLRGSGCLECGKKKTGLKQSKTHEEFIADIAMVNPDIQVLGKYVRSSIKIRCRCRVDGHEWEATPNNLLRGSGCGKCSGNVKNKTTKYFVSEMEKINPSVEILGEYKGNKNKILCRCKRDNHRFMMRPNALISGQGCPKCGGTQALTQAEFEGRLFGAFPDLEVLGKYQSHDSRILVECKKHEYRWEPTANQLLSGSGCPVCGVEKRAKARRKPVAQFEKELKRLSPHIQVLGNYKNNHTKIPCKCNKHNAEFWATPNNLLKGRGCKKCGAENSSKAQLLTHKEFVEKLSKHNPDVVAVGKYINSDTNILVESTLCGHKWETNPKYLIQGTGCPICSSSRGERVVRRYLKGRSIDFNHQHTFEDCRYKSVLFFDFYLPKLQIAIEYDGRQHFEPVDAFGGKREFREIQQRDAVKDRYCKENNIKLIRIPYTEESVEAYLKERLGEVAS